MLRFVNPLEAPLTDDKSTVAKPKRPKALGANMLNRADIVRGNFIAIVPSDTTLDEVLTPAFWANHIPALTRPFARIEVIREDGTMDLDLRVLSVAPGMATVRMLRGMKDDQNLGVAQADSAEAPGVDLSLPDGYKTAFQPQGQNRGHLVRLPNGDILTQGQPTKAAAAAIARAHFAKASTPAPQSAPISSPAPAPATTPVQEPAV